MLRGYLALIILLVTPLAWYSLFRNKEAAINVISGVIILMGMLGGAMWPVEIMPELLQRLAMLMPIYWLMEGMILIIRGDSIVDLMLPLVMMVMFTVAFLLLGSRRRTV